jgi:hypothetical protein
MRTLQIILLTVFLNGCAVNFDRRPVTSVIMVGTTYVVGAPVSVALSPITSPMAYLLDDNHFRSMSNKELMFWTPGMIVGATAGQIVSLPFLITEELWNKLTN